MKNYENRNKILINENKSLLAFKKLKEKEIFDFIEEKKKILDVIKITQNFPKKINFEKLFFFFINFTKILKMIKNKFILQLNEENEIFNKITKILTNLIDLINNGINDFNLLFKIFYGENLEKFILEEKNFKEIINKKKNIFLIFQKNIFFFEDFSKKMVF